MLRIRPASLVALLALQWGCAAHAPPATIGPLELFPALVSCPDGQCRDTVEVTYLGVSGFMIRHGRDLILTGPSFSNPPWQRVLLPWLSTLPDTQLVEALLPPAADSARAILVGHGHYDHLLDVPYIARRRATRATIYGSSTVRHILMGDAALDAAARVEVFAPAEVAGPDRLGTWKYLSPDSTMRVMALEANHAPNARLPFGLIRYTYARGTLTADRSELPRTARGWKEGEVYAFVVDVLASDRRTPIFRIYYQDTASSPPYAMLPPFAGDEPLGVDVALLCVGNYGNVADSPGGIIRATRPRMAILGHWEGFFRRQTQPLRLIRGTNTNRLIERVTAALPPGSGWLMPRPRTIIRFCVCGPAGDGSR
jgi:hypothetical protein